MCSGLIDNLGVIAGRMACILAVALLACASAAHSQVIEEGGFPVKGGDNSGEPFSLTCPPRLYVAAGESLLFSCSATAVPEEGIRYEWESISVGGLDFLSAPDELSPLFMTPSSGAGEKYAYRLTATAPGVYETADVTVSVEGFSGDSAHDRGEGSAGPGDCSSFAFEGYREGCSSKGEGSELFSPFGGDLENPAGLDPFFPGSPGAPGKDVPGSGGYSGPGMATAPYLECPPAVFLEELEVGSIECHVSDALGEEFLEYVWEPVGSTTRDYMDNPRLIPEDSPYPLVVAPEAPHYETLEASRSGETSVRYQYRLTATSRATGLSSFSEVEVFVSGSRPSVYCPEEVEVEEGGSVVLECAGVDPLSRRLDYDEASSPVVWSWTGLWETSTEPLLSTDVPSPVFEAPPGSAGRQYHYIAGMTSSASGESRTARRRVTVTVTGAEEGAQAAEDAASPPDLVCADYSVYAGDPDFRIECEIEWYDAHWPRLDTWVWSNNPDQAFPGDHTERLSSVSVPDPIFYVPDSLPEGQESIVYEYEVNLRYCVYGGPNLWRTESAQVDVRVYNTERPFGVTCPALYRAYEGTDDFALACSATDVPDGVDLTYAWTARGGTANTENLSDTDILTPTFLVPGDVNGDTQYEYTLTASGDTDEVRANATVSILEKPDITSCGSRGGRPHKYWERYEGSGDDVRIGCVYTPDPDGLRYTYEWTVAGSTPATALDRLSDPHVHRPWFYIPDEVSEDTDYRYRITITAPNADPFTRIYVIPVLNKPSLVLNCRTPYEVQEGDDDIRLECSASGAPGEDPDYTYEWTGNASAMAVLTAKKTASPAFAVPDEIDEDETYEYKVTVSAENAEDASKDVFVTVKNKVPVVTCLDPDDVYEGSDDFDLDCSASGASSYTYAWTAWGSTPDTALLSRTDIASPTFDVPEEVAADETYEYKVTLSASGIDAASANVKVRVLNKEPLTLTCTPPAPMYEGSADFDLDCSATGAPAGSDYAYVWTASGSTADTDRLIAGTDGPAPTFAVPEEVDADETYEYLLTVTAENAEPATSQVTVTVLNKKALALVCTQRHETYEGSEDFSFDCSASGAPAGSDYAYVWTARGSTSDTALLTSGTNGPTPTFATPEEVDADETYEYLLTLTAENAEPATAQVTVTVLNKKALALVCTQRHETYEGSEDVSFDCAASGAPAGSDYAYAWTASGNTPDTALLTSGTNGPTPTFDVPEEVDEDETYEYLLTVSAENAIDATAEVTVKVLKLGSIALICASPPLVYEGSEDFELICSVSGDTGDNVDYTYGWTAIGATPNTAQLSATDIPSPTFYVPDEVDATTTYEYLLTARAANVEDATAEVTVTVLNRGALDIACVPPPLAYEGSEDFALDCSASGAPAGSEYAYAWTARGDTPDTALLTDGVDGPAPTFAVPDEIDGTTTYEYLLTVSAENAESGTAAVTVTVLNRGALAVACTDPPSVYEGSEDFDLDCSASGAPAGSEYDYAWTARGSTANTDLLTAGTDGPTPTFAVPDEVDGTTTYEYRLTVSAANVESSAANVTVTVLNRGALAVVCTDPPSVYEGSANFALDCSTSGAPSGSDYVYAWTARGDTPDTALLISGTDGPTPTFAVPNALDGTTTYEYLLTVSADNAESGMAAVTVTVLNTGALSVVCTAPGAVYEGSSDFALDCSASGAPAGSEYAYVWTARGSTANTALLIAGTDGPTPTFAVPAEVEETTRYEYLLTVSTENAESGTAEVTVTVLNRGVLAVACTDPDSVYEGSEDFALDCSVSGAPAGGYTYVWTARGDTPDTVLLISGMDGPTPTFTVPDEVDGTTTYEYLLTVSAENAEDASAEVTVTVLNRGTLAVACTDPDSVYEGSEDFALDCSASGAPAGSEYAYVWTARGSTANTALLIAGTDGPTPTFAAPDALDATTTYEYLLTVSATNAESASAAVTVTVLNRGVLAVVCTDPPSVYEGSEDFALDCSASAAPAGSAYDYVWTARDDTPDTALLVAGTDGPTPTFAVPDALDATTTYEYLLTVSATNAESASAEVTVTVLNRGVLAVVCTDPPSVYEGSEDFALDCSASAAPAGSAYDYVWTARDDTPDTALLVAGTDGPTPTFAVPDEVDEDETYEYLLTVSADNAEDAMAEVTVTVLNRPPGPATDPSPPIAESPPELSEPSPREVSEASSLGVTVSASSLRFGVQSADTQVSLDPMTDQLSTHISGPYHAGRMTLSLDGSAEVDENGNMALSIELASPVVLRSEGGIEDALIVLSPQWSFAESCEQLSSQAIGGLYTETTLSEADCRLLYFGGELDLTDAPSGRYAGSMDVILRSGEREETHSVEVDVTVIPVQRVITIGPGGVRFSTSRELPAGLTEEQNLSIYPDVAFLTEEKPHGVFELSNPSLVPLEVTVSARFGYTEATANGREAVVEEASESGLGDLSSVVNIHPNVLVLQPGEKGLIRYGVETGALASMSEKGYAAFFDVVSEPRQYVRTDRMPEEVTGDRTARVTMRVPGVYVPGEGASQLRATLLSISYVGSMSATFLVETQDRPFVGEVAAYDDEGHELGRRETLVYTRSRVRVPLDRMPEGGAVFLRFAPWGGLQAPEAVSVPWDAPRRDIGAAEDKDRATTTETLARKH